MPVENQALFRQVRSGTTIPLAIGEIFTSPWDADTLIRRTSRRTPRSPANATTTSPPTPNDGGHPGSITIRRVPVLSAAQIAQLPAGRVLIVTRGMPVTIGTVQMAWKRRDVRRATRQLAAAKTIPAVEPAEPIGEVVGVILPADTPAA